MGADTLALLVLVGFVAGVVNAGAGGSTFIAFPALTTAGLSPVAANVACAVGLWAANLTSLLPLRRQLADAPVPLLRLVFVGTAGALLGAWLLLATGEAAFSRLVPLLLLGATVVYASSDRLLRAVRALRSAQAAGSGHGRGAVRAAGFATEFAVGVYGGYFGAGLGIMLLAGLALFGLRELTTANAVKNLLVTLVCGIAVAYFVVRGAVPWAPTLALMAGAALGGLTAGTLLRHVPQRLLERLIVAYGLVLSAAYAVRYYGPA